MATFYTLDNSSDEETDDEVVALCCQQRSSKLCHQQQQKCMQQQRLIPNHAAHIGEYHFNGINTKIDDSYFTVYAVPPKPSRTMAAVPPTLSARPSVLSLMETGELATGVPQRTKSRQILYGSAMSLIHPPLCRNVSSLRTQKTPMGSTTSLITSGNASRMKKQIVRHENNNYKTSNNHRHHANSSLSQSTTVFAVSTSENVELKNSNKAQHSSRSKSSASPLQSFRANWNKFFGKNSDNALASERTKFYSCDALYRNNKMNKSGMSCVKNNNNISPLGQRKPRRNQHSRRNNEWMASTQSIHTASLSNNSGHLPQSATTFISVFPQCVASASVQRKNVEKSSLKRSVGSNKSLAWHSTASLMSLLNSGEEKKELTRRSEQCLTLIEQQQQQQQQHLHNRWQPHENEFKHNRQNLHERHDNACRHFRKRSDSHSKTTRAIMHNTDKIKLIEQHSYDSAPSERCCDKNNNIIWQKDNIMQVENVLPPNSGHCVKATDIIAAPIIPKHQTNGTLTEAINVNEVNDTSQIFNNNVIHSSSTTIFSVTNNTVGNLISFIDDDDNDDGQLDVKTGKSITEDLRDVVLDAATENIRSG